MSLTKGDSGGFDRRRRDDGFKISLSKATFNYNLTHIILCVVLTLFLIHIAQRQEKRAFWPPHPSLLSHV